MNRSLPRTGRGDDRASGLVRIGAMSDRPESDETRELRREQALRETRERELAEKDPTEAGTQTHDRRAAKAEYLKQKLAERERSERDAD